MKVNQRERILDYIREFGSITSYEAYADLGITQLGARIKELKDRGYIFNTEYIYKTNRYGEPVMFKKYMLDEMTMENMNHIPVLY